MAVGYCTRCGAAAVAGARFCPFCGAAYAAPPAPSVASPGPGFGPGPPVGWGPGTGYGPMGPPIAPPGPADRSALGLFQWAAILLLVAEGISFAALGAFHESVAMTRTGSVALHFGIDPWFLPLVLASGLLQIVGVILMRFGFADLAGGDPRFRTPATLTWLLVGGTLVGLLAVIPLIQGLPGAFNCVQDAVNTNGTGAGCFNGIAAWIAVAGLAGVVAVVGFVAMLLGVWRLGTRYGSSMLHAAAILMIFPFVNLLGTIFLLVVVSERKTALGAGFRPS